MSCKPLGTSSMNSDPAPFELLPWQQAQWLQLVGRRERLSFPHALLLSGPAGVGKRQFAARLAAALVCEQETISAQPCGACRACNLATSGTHPDIQWLEPEEEGKAIRIDAVRALIGRSTLTTQARGSRVFLISPAHAMNRAAANALLKTLEEPTASSTLVLISSEPHRLPATIRSRCQEMVFRPVAPAQAESWLAARVDSEQRGALLSLTGGAPLQVLRAVEENWLEHAEESVAKLVDLKQRKINPMHVVKHWADRPLESVLNDIARACSDLLHLGTGAGQPRLFLPRVRNELQSLANDINLQGLYRFTDELNLLRRQMSHNLNSQMVLEKLVTDWLALTRPGAR